MLIRLQTRYALDAVKHNIGVLSRARDMASKTGGRRLEGQHTGTSQRCDSGSPHPGQIRSVYPNLNHAKYFTQRQRLG